MASWTTNHGNAPIFNDVIELPKSSQQLIYDVCVLASSSVHLPLCFYDHICDLWTARRRSHMQSRKQSKRRPGNEAMCVYVGVGVFIQQYFCMCLYCKKTGGKLRKSSTNRSPHPPPLTLTLDSPSATNYNLLESFRYNILYSPAVFVLYSHRPKSACCLWDNSLIQYYQQ